MCKQLADFIPDVDRHSVFPYNTPSPSSSLLCVSVSFLLSYILLLTAMIALRLLLGKTGAPSVSALIMVLVPCSDHD